jgi:hypothetical protein
MLCRHAHAQNFGEKYVISTNYTSAVNAYDG